MELPPLPGLRTRIPAPYSAQWPEFRLQIDPNDFVVPQVFNPRDERWAKSREAGARVHSQCR